MEPLKGLGFLGFFLGFLGFLGFFLGFLGFLGFFLGFLGFHKAFKRPSKGQGL